MNTTSNLYNNKNEIEKNIFDNNDNVKKYSNPTNLSCYYHYSSTKLCKLKKERNKKLFGNIRRTHLRCIDE